MPILSRELDTKKTEELKAGASIESLLAELLTLSPNLPFQLIAVTSLVASDSTKSKKYVKLRDVLENLMQKTTTKGYAFQMEILVRAKRMGLKIEEVPIVFVDRLFGKSKLGKNEIVIYLKGVAELFFEA